MPKRVSIKGRGADLFFGEESPISTSMAGELELAASDPEELPSEVQDSSDTESEQPTEPLAEALPLPKRKSRPRTKNSPHDPEANGSPTEDPDVIEAIRQIVKLPGREVSYVRLTPEEKARLSDVIYTFKRQGQKTTETEVNRIALNYLLNDFFEHGEQSVLARVLAALAA